MDHFISASANAAQAVFPMVPLNPWQVPFFCQCFINKRLHFVKGIKEDLYPSKKNEGNVLSALGLQTEGKTISSFNLVHNCMVSDLYFQHHVFGSAKLSYHLSSSTGFVWLCYVSIYVSLVSGHYPFKRFYYCILSLLDLLPLILSLPTDCDQFPSATITPLHIQIDFNRNYCRTVLYYSECAVLFKFSCSAWKRSLLRKNFGYFKEGKGFLVTSRILCSSTAYTS